MPQSMSKSEKVSVEMSAEFLACAQGAVTGGEFGSIQQVVEAALHSWTSSRERELERVRAMLHEGIASGFEPWNGIDGILAEGRQKLAERRA